MNRISAIIIAALALALCSTTYLLLRHDDPTVATYLGGKISASQLEQELQSRYGRQVLDEMLTARLIKQAIARKKITLSDEELELWVKDYKKRPDAQEIIASNQFDEQKLRENLKTSVPLYYLALGNVPESDRRRYFKENKDRFEELDLRHIVLASEQEALDLYDRMGGEDTFMALALVHSLDDQTRDSSGALGRVTKAELKGSFEVPDVEMLFTLKPGDISLPIRSNSGAWHLFYIRSSATDYEQLKLRVVEELAQRKLKQCLENLVKEAKVEILLPTAGSQEGVSSSTTPLPALSSTPATQGAIPQPSPANGLYSGDKTK